MEDHFFLIAVLSLSWFGEIVIIRNSNSVSVKKKNPNVVFPVETCVLINSMGKGTSWRMLSSHSLSHDGKHLSGQMGAS